MSIIGKLLSLKEKPKKQSPQIPPNIERLVRNKSSGKKEWVKYIIVLLISAGFAFMGYFGVQRLYVSSRAKGNERAEIRAQVHRASIPQLPTSTTVPQKEAIPSTTTTLPPTTVPSKQAELAEGGASNFPSAQTTTITLVQETSTTTTQAPKPPTMSQPKASLAKKVPTSVAPSGNGTGARPRKVTAEKGKPAQQDTAVSTKEEFELVSKNEAERDMYIYQAKAYEGRGDILNAIEYYKKAVGLDPKNFKLQNQLAAACIQIKDGKCAVEHAQVAIQLNPEYIPGMVNLAIGFALLGRDLEAEEQLLKALAKNPNNTFGLKNLGLIYEKRGDLTKAQGIYQKLISLGDPEGYLGLARVLEGMNMYQEAADIYNMICKNSLIEDGIKAYAIQRLNMLTPLLKR